MIPSPPLDADLRTTLDQFHADRPPGADEDVHMCAAIVDSVIERFSAPGDLVFDPFAGFGTTLARAVRLGRRAGGVELLPERVERIRAVAPEAAVVAGDARVLLPGLAAALGGGGASGSAGAASEAGGAPARAAGGAGGASGAASLVLTSPPYMTVTDHEADPLAGYEEPGGDYALYLQQLGDVAAECARLLAPCGYVVWNVADIFHAGVHTPLIDDCAALLGRHLERVAVEDIGWDTLPHDLTRDALLIFRRRG